MTLKGAWDLVLSYYLKVENGQFELGGGMSSGVCWWWPM